MIDGARIAATPRQRRAQANRARSVVRNGEQRRRRGETLTLSVVRTELAALYGSRKRISSDRRRW